MTPKPYDFASDSALPPHLAAKMQAVANYRAAQGLISPDGKTHRTGAQMALYASGVSPHSSRYIKA
jgi:hypothetical protein